MAKWEMVRLGDVFSSIKNGASIQQGHEPGSGYPITRIETISDGKVNRMKMGYAGIEDITPYASNVLESGDLLMSHINSIKHLGKTALYVKQNNETIIHGMNLLRLRPNHNVINCKFAKHFFDSYYFRKQIPNITKNSVNQSSFTVTAITHLILPLPPLTVQQQIADVLDRASALIEKRKAQIAKLDLLIKSQFIEMFGDPVTNPMRWETSALSKKCDVITGNTPSRATPDNYGNYIEWIKSDNINTPYMHLTHATEMLSEKGLAMGRFVNANTVLMTCIAGSVACIGNVAIADRKVSFNQQINAILPRDNNAYFLYYLFMLSKPYIQSAVSMSLKGILSKGRLLELEFPFPPISFQNKFAILVERIESIKSLLQQSLAKMELNYKSLMQKCFRGEIF